MSDQLLITGFEAALMLGMSRTRLVRIARRGEVPHVVLPDGEIRFRRADLVEWVASYRRPARPPEVRHG